MAWISWASTYLITYTFAFVCLFVFLEDPQSYTCILLAEMYLADKTAEISMISGTEYFHVFNSCPVYFRRSD